jgi:glycosyltransferase involved in cell wall biosynthesis
MNHPNLIEKDNVILSVVIPCFNHGEFLLEAIASVEACQGNFYEIIIVNDGSTDPATVELMNDLKQKGYWVIDQPNQGQATARNTGIQAANGRYIIPLDSDNKIRTELIQKGIEILDRQPEIAVVYGDLRLFNDRGKVRTFTIQPGCGSAEYINEQEWIWKLPDFDLNRLVLFGYLDACAVIRKSVWLECGGYDTKIPVNGFEDWELWLNMAKKGCKFHHVSSVLHDYRFIYDPSLKEWHVPQKRQIALKYIRKKHFDLFLKAYLWRVFIIWPGKVPRKISQILTLKSG